jgi:hypothetical protein
MRQGVALVFDEVILGPNPLRLARLALDDKRVMHPDE